MISLIEERVLYKKLKEEKLFAKFSLMVSQPFVNNLLFENPRSKYDEYKIGICDMCSNNDKRLDAFIHSVKKWEVDINKIKIL